MIVRNLFHHRLLLLSLLLLFGPDFFIRQFVFSFNRTMVSRVQRALLLRQFVRPFVCLSVTLRYHGYIQCESKKCPPRGPDIFHFLHKRLRIFNRFFTHLLCVPIYARLQIFIQLSPILTQLWHIKRDYPVHIIYSKCPQSAETHALTRLRKSLTALLIMWDRTWRQQWRHLLSKQT